MLGNLGGSPGRIWRLGILWRCQPTRCWDFLQQGTVGLCRSDKGRFIQGRGAAGQVAPRQVDANSGATGSRIPGEEPGRVDDSNSRIGETKGSRSPLSKTLTLQRPHSISLTGIVDRAWNGRGGSSDLPCGTLEGAQARRGASVDGGETVELRVTPGPSPVLPAPKAPRVNMWSAALGPNDELYREGVGPGAQQPGARSQMTWVPERDVRR